MEKIHKSHISRLSVILGVVCVVLLIAGLWGYSQHQSIVYSLNATIKNLSEEKEDLISEKESIQSELSSAEDSIKSKDTGFTNYRSLLKKYVSLSKVVMSDTRAISTTIDEYYNEKSEDYAKNKQIVDKYEAQFNVMKNHIDDYKNLLRSNDKVFEEIGVGVKDEVATVDNGLIIYEGLLVKMHSFLEQIR